MWPHRKKILTNQNALVHINPALGWVRMDLIHVITVPERKTLKERSSGLSRLVLVVLCGGLRRCARSAVGSAALRALRGELRRAARAPRAPRFFVVWSGLVLTPQ